MAAQLKSLLMQHIKMLESLPSGSSVRNKTTKEQLINVRVILLDINCSPDSPTIHAHGEWVISYVALAECASAVESVWREAAQQHRRKLNDFFPIYWNASKLFQKSTKNEPT